jgi:NAD(P)-dependent dehydrogenase (short-subunit alcohol dehydrogenase family)
MTTDYHFADQVALITGGGRGLGRAFAATLAQTGATVAIVARSEDQLRDVAQAIEQSGGRAFAFAADVTDRQAMEHIVAKVERQLGRIDLLVNTAGVFHALGSIAEIDPDDWWREVEINVRGTFLCTRAVLPGMIARGRGRIINLASAAGLRALPTTSAYCLSKTAVIRFSESLAIEYGDHGVCAFAMHPGTVRTPLADYIAESDEIGRRAPGVQQWFQQIYRDGADTPIERSVALLMLLASGKADALSGRFIDVDDDLDALVQQAEAIQRDDLFTLRLRTQQE